jgi:energy-coupling factor transporter ATP-binding protein EcfA2
MASTTGRHPIELRAVRYQYAGSRTWALDGVDLDVPAGAVVGLIGANDAGKTTLALVAAGLAPSVTGGKLEGAVWLIDGQTSEMAPHEAAARCGILFQNALAQLSGTSATVWEEIAFGPRNAGLAVQDISRRVEGALDVLRIQHLAPKDPNRLSGGEAQLVALGSVLALRPKAMVLDEPTSQLDPGGTRLVGEAIERIAAETGAGILVIEHKTGLLDQIAESIVVLEAGRTIRQGDPSVVLCDPALVDLGIDPPPVVRLGRAIGDAGLSKTVRSDFVRAVRALGHANAGRANEDRE